MLTAFIGGSLLLLVASATSLVLGWGNSNERLILGSMAASVGAGLLLLAAVLTSRRRPASDAAEGTDLTVAPPPAPPPPLSETEAEETKAARRRRGAAKSKRSKDRATSTSASEGSAAIDAPPLAAASLKSDRSVADTEEPAAGAVAKGEVVAIPDRKRFHRPDCRYAKARGAEPMSKAAARGRGYVACGVCKP